MILRPQTGKADLHLHSYASNVTDYYAANALAIPESYSDPIETHRELQRQGMDLFTLTDHNSIDGVKEMLDRQLPGVFVSAEMTTTFPEDGCNVHVTVANMTEAQFEEVNRLRSNIYEMLDYVEQQIAAEASHAAGNRVAYWMTHPLMSTQNRPYGRHGALTAEHIEKAMLLLPCLEVRNGTRTRHLNEFTHRLLRALDQEMIERLANKHDLVPRGSQPWKKAVVGGSDDHSGINPGQTWTEFPMPEGRAPEPNDLVDAIRARRTAPAGAHGGPITLAHAMVKLLYDGQRIAARGQQAAGRSMSMGGPIQDLLQFVFDSGSVKLHQKLAFQSKLWIHRLLEPRSKRRVGPDVSFEKILASEARLLMGDKQFRAELAGAERTDDRIFTVVSTLVNRIFLRYVDRVQAASSSSVVRVIKEVVAMISSNLFVSLPYFVSHLSQAADASIVRDVRKNFGMREEQRLVLVTDTFFEINGVTRTIRRMIDEAEGRGLDFVVLTCVGPDEEAQCLADDVLKGYIERGRLKILRSLVNFDLPEYRGLQVRVPPLLEMIRWLQEEGFQKMQISTPGTVGLAGLLAAKLLQLETSATYHTSFPEYVEDYTGDISLEALTWKYMVLFYQSVDEVVVPSKFIARQLHERGLRNRKLLILDRWVDTERFSPRHRSSAFWERFGVRDAAEKKLFLYVGRVGLEKNLDVMASAFERVAAAHDDVHLVVVGDGPFRDELERRLEGQPCTFTGFLEGDELLTAFASADVKLFPSTTDTWGNAPLEAQASGLPVIVSDQGGPQELVLDEVTGYVVRGRDVDALHAAMCQLLDDTARREMGRRARDFALQGVLDEPFSAILDSPRYRRRVKAAKKLAKRVAAEEPVDAAAFLDTYLVDHRESLDQEVGA